MKVINMKIPYCNQCPYHSYQLDDVLDSIQSICNLGLKKLLNDNVLHPDINPQKVTIPSWCPLEDEP